MSTGAERFPVHTDARGALLAVEDAGVGFAIRRVFTVVGSDERSPRGGHAPGCRELLVLVSGRVTGSVGRTAGVEWFDLSTAGESVRIDPLDPVDYQLDAGSVLLVLCDRPFEETS